MKNLAVFCAVRWIFCYCLIFVGPTPNQKQDDDEDYDNEEYDEYDQGDITKVPDEEKTPVSLFRYHR